LKQYKIKNTFLDNVFLYIYVQFFYPNISFFGLLIPLFWYCEHNSNPHEALPDLLLSIALSICAVVTFALIGCFFFAFILQIFGGYKNHKEELMTFADDYYIQADPTRELKWFWKYVTACYGSDYQLFINNSNNIFYHITCKGVSAEEWKEINDFIRQKVKVRTLAFHTNLIILAALIGIFRWYLLLK
jgi:hypothetical protein